MSKRVAVVDIGSNSVRMAIFERTSRLGFFILREYKIKARLSDGAYERAGVLQERAMDRVCAALREFKRYIDIYGVRRVLCVGTSALRDAPNAAEFIKKARSLGFNIRVIDGQKEAFYGGLAALNLLKFPSDAVTLDIGGGSSELARIKDGKITDVISLNLGTVRLKELFFDKKDINGASKFVAKFIDEIPPHFASENLIAIGGSLRAIGGAVMAIKSHPLKLVHNFSYDFNSQSSFLKKLIGAQDLRDFPIKKDRYDTIKEGVLIFSKIAEKLGAKTIFSSGVGVREGVFLENLLRPGLKFPSDFNPSVKSLQDRFATYPTALTTKFCARLFELLAPLHGLERRHLNSLLVASKLYNLGRSLGFYSERDHSAYIVRNGLSFGFSHEERALIAQIIEFQGKEIKDLGAYESLLPDIKDVRWLSFLLSTAAALSVCDGVEFEFGDNTLRILGAKDYIGIKDAVKKIPKPALLALSFD